MANPDAAVLIAAYNAEATLDRAVASALAQPEAAEICIVDDASADRTADVAMAWAEREPRVKALRQPENAGPAAARNRALAETKAPWVAILDADDFLLEGRLGRVLAYAERADFIADALIRVADPGLAPEAPTAGAEPRALSFAEFVRGNLGAAKGPLDLGFLKPIFRRSFAEIHDLRYQPEMRLGEDYEFYARALALGARFLVLGPAGYVSVERPGSLSKDHSEADLQRLRDCDLALQRLRTFSRAERLALRRHWTSVDCRLQWRRLISAVKARDAAAALATFHSPDAALYLAARLSGQAWLRSAAALRRQKRRANAARWPAS
jgi:succinoglycan biosynthesis protein ExoU